MLSYADEKRIRRTSIRCIKENSERIAEIETMLRRSSMPGYSALAQQKLRKSLRLQRAELIAQSKTLSLRIRLLDELRRRKSLGTRLADTLLGWTGVR